jgi:hypothetical protein
MEVEVSGNFLDCSRYWPFALVAENSHVVHLDMEGRAPKGTLVAKSLSFLMPQPVAPQNAKMLNIPNEKHGSKASEPVSMTCRSDESLRMNVSGLRASLVFRFLTLLKGKD